MDRVDATVRDAKSHSHDVVLGDDALDRAAERGRETDVDLCLGMHGVAQRDDRAHVVENLVVRLADVGDRVRLADRNGNRQRVHTSVERDPSVPKIRHEHRDSQTRDGQRVAHDIRAVGHLRQRTW